MEAIITEGVWAIIGVGIIMALAMLLLHFMAQRSQQQQAEMAQQNLANIHSMGIEAIVGANNMQIIDNALENHANNRVTSGETKTVTTTQT